MREGLADLPRATATSAWVSVMMAVIHRFIDIGPEGDIR